MLPPPQRKPFYILQSRGFRGWGMPWDGTAIGPMPLRMLGLTMQGGLGREGLAGPARGAERTWMPSTPPRQTLRMFGTEQPQRYFCALRTPTLRCRALPQLRYWPPLPSPPGPRWPIQPSSVISFDPSAHPLLIDHRSLTK